MMPAAGEAVWSDMAANRRQSFVVEAAAAFRRAKSKPLHWAGGSRTCPFDLHA
jgi:hypothetical protein